MHPYRARFKKEIVTEFLPPVRYNAKKPQKAVVFCDGMPTVPKKHGLLELMSKKGYWVFHPRYRGSWESGGEFLRLSPEQDILDLISHLPGGFQELTWGKKFNPVFNKIFVVGGSFGGPAAILASRDKRVTKAIAISPVTDWKISTGRKTERAETNNSSYVRYIQRAFGNGYRVSDRNWNKLRGGKFYNPMPLWREIDSDKILLYHAKDDSVVAWKESAKFAKLTGAKLVLWRRGGHMSTERTLRRDWKRVNKFLKSK